MKRSHPGPLTVVLTVVVGMLMVGIDVSIVAVAFTQLARDTGATLPELQWVSTGYALALATVIPVTAWAMNRFGARAVFLTAIAVFTIASALVAGSWSVPSMAAFRVLQGLGGGLVMPAAMALTLSAAPPERRGRLMAVMTLPAFVAPVFGPVLGGWLLDALSWRWMFLINVPIGALSFVLGLRNLPRPQRGPVPPLDVRGLFLLPPAMALLIWGSSTASPSKPGAQFLLPMAAGLLLLATFTWHAHHSQTPLLDIRLLHRRLTSGGSAVLFLFQGGFATSLILMPLYWQVVRGESATTAGLLMAPGGLAIAIVLQLSGRLIDRLPPVAVIGPGITLAALAGAALAVQLTATAPTWRLVLTTVVLGVGAAFTLMPTMTVATRSLTGPDIPSGASLLAVISQMSVSVGVAAFSVVLADQLAAKSTGSGSPDPLGATAPHLAPAFQVTFWFPVAFMVLGAIAAWLVFRGEPRPPASTPGASAAPVPSDKTAVE